MSFLGGGPECSTGANPLNQFQKHVQDDKSLQRDRLVGRGGVPQEGMRMQRGGGGADGMMDEFMAAPAQMPHQPPPAAMEAMRRDFEAMHTAPPAAAGQRGSWAGEFEGGVGVEETMRMEAAFAQGRPESAEAWARPAANGTAAVAGQVAAPFPPRAGMGMYQSPMGLYGGMGMGRMGMMGGVMPMGAAAMRPQVPVEVQGKGKGRMVELDDTDWEAQFAQMESDEGKAAEGDLDDEANAAIERELDDFDRSVPDHLSDTDRFGRFEDIWQAIQSGDALSSAANLTDARKLFADNEAFSDLPTNFREHMGEFPEWENFDGGLNTHLRDPASGEYLFEEENVFKSLHNPFDEGVRIMDSGGNLTLAALAFEAAVQKDPAHVEAWTRLGAAQAQNEKEQPAIRALEQAIKLDPGNLEALMGLAVSYTNEGYDSIAYRTLERWLSTKYPSISPPTSSPDSAVGNTATLSDPLSYEFGFTDRQLLHEKVTHLFISAAQLSPSPESMDPDVQVGLGVLFYGAEEFDKAVDCFSAALGSSEAGHTTASAANQRPLLWNRLGATLANSGRSEEAIQAYEKALELNPNFVRARYNLGVSCINIGCFAEAAQHLLGALAMHAVVEKEGREKAREIVAGEGGGGGGADEEIERIMRQNQSTNLYDTLRRVFGQMGRKDLAEKVVNGVDVDVFRGEFDF